MKVYFGSDNHGNALRPKLVAYANKLGYKSEDLGTDIDFPVMAQRVVKKVLKHKGSVGILMCGTGQGMAIAANRHLEIRAALCNTVADAKRAREHLDANVLTLGADRIKNNLAKKIVKTFLSAAFIEEGRYKRRIQQIGL